MEINVRSRIIVNTYLYTNYIKQTLKVQKQLYINIRGICIELWKQNIVYILQV